MNLNLPPGYSLALLIVLAVGTLLGPSGIMVWLRFRGQKGLDKSTKNEIDTRVENLTRTGLHEAQQEFDRKIGELRDDQAEDRTLAEKRYKRLVDLEKFTDRVVPYYRKVDVAFAKVDVIFSKLIRLIPGGTDTLSQNGIGSTLAENGIVMPAPPMPPVFDDE